MNKLLIGAVSAMAVTTLAACGSSGGNSAADTAKASIKAEILQNASTSSTNPFKMSDSQAGCTANNIVDSFGVDKLRSYGLLTADNKVTNKKVNETKFSAADATTAVNVIFQCVGDATITSLLKTEVDTRLPSTVTAAQKSCIEGKLTAAALKPLFIAQLSGQTGALTQFESTFASCLIP